MQYLETRRIFGLHPEEFTAGVTRFLTAESDEEAIHTAREWSQQSEFHWVEVERVTQTQRISTLLGGKIFSQV